MSITLGCHDSGSRRWLIFWRMFTSCKSDINPVDDQMENKLISSTRKLASGYLIHPLLETDLL